MTREPPPSISPGAPAPGARAPALARTLGTLATVLVALAIAAAFARDALSAALLFVVVLVGLVVAHELAHFATAKLFGVRVLEFGVGFPPRIAAWRIGETEYSLNWLPLGGFVRLLGEEDPTDRRSLAAQPAWQRLIVLVSGSVINLVLPVVLFAFAFTWPHEEPIGRAQLDSVLPDSPAEAAGLRAGDVIYEIGGRNAKNVAEAGRYIRLNVGHETEFLVRRDGEFVTVRITPRWTPPEGQGPTGIVILPQQPFTERVVQPPWESLPNGLRATAESMLLARNELLSWIKGGSSPQVAGPVAIAQTTGEAAREGGVSPVLELAALLSINLGVMNLLPLPMLDGGRAVFVVIEVLRRGRRIAPEKEALVHFVGFILFIALAVVVTFSDISRIVAGESLFR
ncbi:MAG: site-2 protease family protein [Chloroflexi bacterium]|nr:site-2 protease family protein [Chloroflexota bacterium]